ncbi:MAG TPA: Ig-like domain-containing protein [Acidobacteriaceae bacterium]|nr:Ig-like domain-containing protein [Acidobacteriaceae bacterium]
MRISPPVVLALLGFAAPAFAGVTVASPANSTAVTSPTTFVANATTSCRKGVASMGIYVDDQLVFVVNSPSMNTSLRMSLGQHYVVVQDWDYCGASSKKALTLNVVQPTVSFGSVNVSAPTPGQTVTSPFLLSATDVTCEGQPVSTMAYSLDNSGTLLALANGTSLNTQVTASAGQHALHVKSWGPNYAACDTDLTVNVVTVTAAFSPSAISVIPSTAIANRNIQTYLDWRDWFDTGTVVGSDTTASGSYASLISSPSLSGSARQFVSTFVDNGGILYYDNVTGSNPDTTSQNWFLDQWVYVAAPSSDLANVEIDMNQLDAAGNTIIMGFQCDGWNGVWDYTWTDTGTHWTQSKQPCNPRNWSTNAWHHVQIYFSHDNQDNVTYHSVWFDGQEQDINATVYSALPLGWAKSNILNFQIDGMGQSGTITTYLDNVTVYHW